MEEKRVLALLHNGIINEIEKHKIMLNAPNHEKHETILQCVIDAFTDYVIKEMENYNDEGIEETKNDIIRVLDFKIKLLNGTLRKDVIKRINQNEE